MRFPIVDGDPRDDDSILLDFADITILDPSTVPTLIVENPLLPEMRPTVTIDVDQLRRLCEESRR